MINSFFNENGVHAVDLSSAKPCRNEDGNADMVYYTDMADEIDSLADRIAQMFKEGGADRIAHWHLSALEAEASSAVAKRTAQIVAFLFQPCRNVRAKILGLMFSSELATRLNGVRNMSDQAKKDGVSRALISHYSREWDRTFGYKISRAFGKSPQACRKYSEARVRYLERQKTK
jgi:hypothetical protein